MNGIHPFELDSFEAESRRIVEIARGEARRILEAALAERERIRAKAREEGLGAGRMEGRKTGIQEGREKLVEETAGVTELLGKIVDGLKKKRAEFEALAEREVVRLAILIAERIVKIEVKARSKVVVRANVLRAVELSARRHGLVVRVNPRDRTAVRTYLPAVLAAFPEAEGIELQSDKSILRGSCVVISEEGSVDADIVTQLKEIERSLLK